VSEEATVSTKKRKQQTTSRADKRARFAEPEKRSGASPLVLVAGIVIVLALVGGTLFMLTRPKPAVSAALPGAAGDEVASKLALSDEWQVAAAATHGHDPYPLVTAEDGTVRLPLSTFDDYQAHHYTYMHQGRPIEFFVLKSQDGVVRAAFNACDVCYGAKQGYTQDGDHMVCNNCGRRFPADQINVVHGGCNPSPLTRVVEGDQLVIPADAIISGSGYF
jgi:hypothetical protein